MRAREEMDADRQQMKGQQKGLQELKYSVLNLMSASAR